MTRANPADTVCWPLVWTLVSPGAPDLPVLVDVEYAASDPVAVTIAFRTDPIVTWMCTRALLRDGIQRRVGEGDIRIQPDSPQSVLICLSSPAGGALFRTGAAALAEFLDATFSLVPAAAEAELIAAALDAELSGLREERPS